MSSRLTGTTADSSTATTTSRAQLFRDPIYRIMHTFPRSDVLEVVRCKFAKEHCQRAAAYFDASFMQNPLRRLRLQIGCDGPTGLHLFFPRIAFHRFALRTLDLSRNRLSADDVVTLCTALELTPHRRSRPRATDEGEEHAGSSSLPSHYRTSVLELLDLSYNSGIGNEGAVQLMRAITSNSTIRAVQLKCIGVDDDGACALAPLLCRRPTPAVAGSGTSDDLTNTSATRVEASQQRMPGFFLNLNENRIGARGTTALGKGLPDFVSVTLCKQRVKEERQ